MYTGKPLNHAMFDWKSGLDASCFKAGAWAAWAMGNGNRWECTARMRAAAVGAITWIGATDQPLGLGGLGLGCVGRGLGVGLGGLGGSARSRWW